MCCGIFCVVAAVSELIFAVFCKNGFHALNIFRRVYATGRFAATVVYFYHLNAQPIVKESHLLQSFYAADFIIGLGQLKVVFQRAERVGIQTYVAAYGALLQRSTSFLGLADSRNGALGERHSVTVLIYQHRGAAVRGALLAFHQAVVLIPIQVDAGSKDIARSGLPLVDKLLDNPRGAQRVVALQVDDKCGGFCLLAYGIPAAFCAAAAGFGSHNSRNAGSLTKVGNASVVRSYNVAAILVVAANGFGYFCNTANHFLAGNFYQRLARQTCGGVTGRYNDKYGLRHGKRCIRFYTVILPFCSLFDKKKQPYESPKASFSLTTGEFGSKIHGMKQASILIALSSVACCVAAANESVLSVCTALEEGLEEQLTLLSSVQDAASATRVVEPLRANFEKLQAYNDAVPTTDLWRHIENNPELKNKLVLCIQYISIEFRRLGEAQFFGCEELRAMLTPLMVPVTPRTTEEDEEA